MREHVREAIASAEALLEGLRGEEEVQLELPASDPRVVLVLYVSAFRDTHVAVQTMRFKVNFVDDTTILRE